jgi:hypothetical protein
MAVTSSAATQTEQHHIRGCLVGAHSLLHALSRVDPASVNEQIQQATKLAAQVGQPKTSSGETAQRGEDTDRGHSTSQ